MLLFAVVKFTEGAWLIVIIFPVLVFILIRLNREYRAEAASWPNPATAARSSQPPNYSRRVVLLLVDDYDLATVAALKYARGLRPTVLRAVHFSLDSARADRLRQQWVDAGTGIPLELADCPDRRLAHAAARLAASLAAVPDTHVTVVLPRRSYPPLAGRLLHDHTADRIARVVSRVPDAAATIVPFDVSHRVETARADAAGPVPAAQARAALTTTSGPRRRRAPTPSGRCASPATPPSRAACAPRRSGPARQPGTPCWPARSADSTGELTAVFLRPRAASRASSRAPASGCTARSASAPTATRR